MARPITPDTVASGDGDELGPDEPAPRGYKRTRRGRIKRRNILWRLRKWLLAFVVLSILASSGAAYAVWVNTPLPKPGVLIETSFLCLGDVSTDCNKDNALAQFSTGENRVVVTYNQIPTVFINALVSAEDKGFFTHQGVDPVGVARALYADIRNTGAGRQGGSTLTQQYVKNVTGDDDPTLGRKVTEAVQAMKLTREQSKEQILEGYLNTIYFGRGAYGIEAAAQAYFGLHVEQLELKHSAYLASIIREPELTDARRAAGDPQFEKQQKYATTRRKQVLNTMLEQGYITVAQRDEVAALGWDYVNERRSTSGSRLLKDDNTALGYWVDYVEKWLKQDGRISEKDFAKGGLRIYTTLDPGQQQLAYDAVTSTLNEANDPLGALVSIDQNGFIRAMVGGRDHRTSQFNLALGGENGSSGRQVGSTMKPIVLARYLADGHNLDETIFDAREILDPSTGHKIENKHATNGPLDLAEALARSSNTVYFDMQRRVRLDETHRLATELGMPPSAEAADKHGNGYVLGQDSASVLNLASAYSVFARRGLKVGPWPVAKVTNAQGRVLWEAPAARARVLDERVADEVNFAMTRVIDDPDGTAKDLRSERGALLWGPLAGKTGTTEENKDALFAGFNCRLTTAVWVGYDQPRPMTKLHGYDTVDGGTLPADIFAKYMAPTTLAPEGCPPYERWKDPNTPTTTVPTTYFQQATTTFRRRATTSTIDEDESTTTSSEPEESTTTLAATTTTRRTVTSSTVDGPTTTLDTTATSADLQSEG